MPPKISWWGQVVSDFKNPKALKSLSPWVFLCVFLIIFFMWTHRWDKCFSQLHNVKITTAIFIVFPLQGIWSWRAHGTPYIENIYIWMEQAKITCIKQTVAFFLNFLEYFMLLRYPAPCWPDSKLQCIHSNSQHFATVVILVARDYLHVRCIYTSASHGSVNVYV